MKTKQLLKRLENKRNAILLALVDSDSDVQRSIYQFKLTIIENTILEIKRNK